MIIKELIEELQKFPDHLPVDITINTTSTVPNGMNKAIEKLDAIRQELTDLSNRLVDIEIDITASTDCNLS